MIKRLLDSIKVHDCELSKMRIGNRNDGGYVVLREICKDHTNAIYSFGIGDDISFEEDFTRAFNSSIPVRLYDPTIDKAPESEFSFEFYKQGVGADYPVPKDFKQDSLLKMDIEWHEWKALTDLPARELAKFSQILIELHVIPVKGLAEGNYTTYFKQFHESVQSELNMRLFACYKEVIDKLKEFFYIYHIHANNSLPKVEAEGIEFPPLIELSLVRKDLVENVKETESTFPIEGLDFPNKTDRDDICYVYPLGG